MTVVIRTKLSIKELSPALRLSVSFLYKARMAGLPMEWSAESKCYVQTPAKVRRWLRISRFRIVDGRPRVKKE